MLLGTFAGSSERTASAVEPAGTVSSDVESVYAAESVSVASFSVTSSVPVLRYVIFRSATGSEALCGQSYEATGTEPVASIVVSIAAFTSK